MFSFLCVCVLLFIFCRPDDMTFAVDWKLKTNYLSICPFLCVCVQEIIIFRKADKQRKNYQQALQHHHPINPPLGLAAAQQAQNEEESAEQNSAAGDGDN